MNKIRIVIAGSIVSIIIFFVLFILSFFLYKDFQRESFKRDYKPSPNLRFSFRVCNTDGGEIFENRIESADWINSNTVRVKAKVCSNCGDYDWLGDYTETGNAINLSYVAFSEGDMACGCCPVILKYDISNLKKEKYKYKVELQKRVYY